MKIRRVVTGHDDAGRAVVASDEQVDGFGFAGGGGAFHMLWGTDRPAQFPDDGTPPAWTGAFPPVGGFRFLQITLPPGGSADHPHEDEELQTFLTEGAGLDDYMKDGEPGMHRTPTIDFEVVLSGEIGLELDDGQEVRLRPNDVVVQNGTMHRWHNRGNTPATMAVVVIGANHERFAKS